jgi:uncharacterized membrane protein
MDDKSLGYTIMVVTGLITICYFIWAFAPWLGLKWLETWSEWAYRLPVIAAVFLVLFIILWIGYTMATTPPSIPLENPLELEIEEKEKADK